MTTKTGNRSTKKKKRKLKKKYKIRLLVFTVVVLSALILYFPARKKVENMLHPAPIGTVKVDWYRDLNLIHLKHAKTNGIKPFKTNQQLNDVV